MKIPERTHKVVLLLPFCLGMILLLTSTTQLLDDFWNYDTKRILEITFLPLSFAFALFYRPLRLAFARVIKPISAGKRWLTLAVFSAGIISAVYHAESGRHAAYSILEVLLLSSLVMGALILAAVRTLTGDTFDRLMLSFLVILGLAVGAQELAGVAAANSAGLEFSFRISLLNFSWPRFFNQVQSWTIPVLAALPALFWKKPLARVLCIGVIGLNWYILLMTGARGTVVGLVMALSALLVLFPSIRRETITWHLAGFVLGAAIYIAILFSMTSAAHPEAPDYSAQAPVTESQVTASADQPENQKILSQSSFYNQSLGRTMLNTSGRWAMWQGSLNDIWEHPFLGIGPMNFACKGLLTEAGHPHSFPLQMSGEWGLPAFVALIILLGSLALAAFKRLRTSPLESESQQLLTVLLVGGILTAAVHACLSGVMVMPASQLTGMLICGWFIGILSLRCGASVAAKLKHKADESEVSGLLVVFLAISLFMLVFSLHEVTLREENMTQTQIGDRLIPRFWQNGKMCGI